jgi:glucosamine-phosphate N-acetyltransferase
MEAADLARAFFTALCAIKPVHLTDEQELTVFHRRTYAGVRTHVAMIDDRVVGTASLLIEPKFIHGGGGGAVEHIEDVAVRVGDQQPGHPRQNCGTVS